MHVSSREDVIKGLTLYEKVREANEAGVSPEVWKEYTEILKEKGSLTKREWKQKHYEKYHNYLGEYRFKSIIEILRDTGLITETTDPTDKRRIIYRPVEKDVLDNTEQSEIQW